MLARRYTGPVRTTIDLPADLHNLAKQLAHDGNQSMSDVVVALIRAGLQHPGSRRAMSDRGMPLVSVSRSVSAQDVRALDDE